MWENDSLIHLSNSSSIIDCNFTLAFTTRMLILTRISLLALGQSRVKAPSGPQEAERTDCCWVLAWKSLSGLIRPMLSYRKTEKPRANEKENQDGQERELEGGGSDEEWFQLRQILRTLCTDVVQADYNKPVTEYNPSHLIRPRIRRLFAKSSCRPWSCSFLLIMNNEFIGLVCWRN